MVPSYALWLPRQLLSRGGHGGRARKAGACSLGRVVGWWPRGWSQVRRFLGSQVPMDSGLFPCPSLSSSDNMRLHWRRRSIFCFSPVFVLCCASQWIVCFSMLGKEKNRNASPCYQLCRSSSHLGEFSLGWFGVMSEASWERSSGCWPLQLAGVFNRGGVGEGMSCWMGPSPPPCRRERGLSGVGFSAGGRRESLNREENKTTPSLTFLSVRS